MLDVLRVVTVSFEILLCIATSFIVFLNIIWCGYFFYNCIELRKRIRYLSLPKQDCTDRLLNSQVAYVKSKFIVAICLVELFPLFSTPFTIKYDSTLVGATHWNDSNCTGLDNLMKNPVFRLQVAVSVYSLLALFWLLIGLNNYLTKAYGTNRITKFHAPLLRIELLVSGIISILAIPMWELFLIITPIIVLIMGIQIFLMFNSSKLLYVVIKRRCMDALFESKEEHLRLERMRKSYFRSTIMVILYQSVLFCAAVYAVTYNTFIWVISSACFYSFGMHKEFEFRINSWPVHNDLFLTLIALVLMLILLMMHLMIVKHCVVKIMQRRKLYRSAEGGLNQPLIGEK